MQLGVGAKRLQPSHGPVARGEGPTDETVLENSDESAAAARTNPMTGLHSPWPLFSDDLNLARSWLRPQLQGFVPLRIGHVAISLGLGNDLLLGVRQGDLHADINSLHQWQFRVARLRGESNPYRHLLPEGLLEDTFNTIEHSKNKGLPLSVELNGGIGDHLEALCLLIPWAKAQNYCLHLEMSAERQQQIGPLLPEEDWIQCHQKGNQGTKSIPVMALRSAVVGQPEPAHYCAWLGQEEMEPQGVNLRWLCCWRAEGAGDRLSAHSRSVPWPLVQKFYLQLQRLHPQSCIVDITNWNQWEASQLRNIGVEILNPRQGTLLDLAQECRLSRVVTIDTALVHLCAAAGQKADLLLSAYPDERWYELHRPEHNYGQAIKLWRSTQFGSWSAVLSSLITSLAAKV